MNQILVTNDKNSVSSIEMKPIIRFFAIIIIVVAIVLSCIGGYNLYKSLQQKDNYAKPNLSVEKNGSAVNLIIKGEIGINKVEYKWNEGNSTIIKGNGKKDVNLEIEIPQGNNKLNIVVVDVEGNKTNFENIDVVFETTEDTVKPKISIINTTGKLSVTATDETELDYLTYQWENEEEVKIDVTEENNKTITQDIKVQKGTKALIITAVDKTGNKATITKTIVGSNGPQIKVSVKDNNFIVKVTTEYGLTKIEYTLNEKVNTVENVPKNSKEFEFRVPLEDGVNYLKINAYENELMTEYKCKKTK